MFHSVDVDNSHFEGWGVNTKKRSHSKQQHNNRIRLFKVSVALFYLALKRERERGGERETEGDGERHGIPRTAQTILYFILHIYTALSTGRGRLSEENWYIQMQKTDSWSETIQQ